MSQAKYDVVSRVIHWLVAIGIFTLIGIGISFSYVTNTECHNMLLYVHKSTALTVFFLMVIRVFWRLKYMYIPEYQPEISNANRTIGHIAHMLIYIGVFIMIFSGWIGSSVLGYPVPFWFVNLALPLPINPNFGMIMFEVHEITIWILGTIIALHILGVIHHTFKKEKILERML
ncbi:cytochrome b/b6 domain-containing protein [Francisellaceae bacterium]|nr:cytochrome b/b6 domain-containing protein [Francisellaceae bacterium]